MSDIELSCSYCDEYSEILHLCDMCNGLYCSDHHADFGLCINCANPKDFKESMENR